jgi:hypothetical protein
MDRKPSSDQYWHKTIQQWEIQERSLPEFRGLTDPGGRARCLEDLLRPVKGSIIMLSRLFIEGVGVLAVTVILGSFPAALDIGLTTIWTCDDMIPKNNVSLQSFDNDGGWRCSASAIWRISAFVWHTDSSRTLPSRLRIQVTKQCQDSSFYNREVVKDPRGRISRELRAEYDVTHRASSARRATWRHTHTASLRSSISHSSGQTWLECRERWTKSHRYSTGFVCYFSRIALQR